MAKWIFECYLTSIDPNLWAEWYSTASDIAKAKHDVAFEFLEESFEWRSPRAKNLQGKYDGIVEIRLDADNIEHRILGFYRPGYRFVILAIGFHKGKVYTPKTLLDIARARMKEVKDDPSRAAKCVRPGAAR